MNNGKIIERIAALNDRDPREALLTTKQAAAELGLSEAALIDWRTRSRAGKPSTNLPWIQLGHRTIRYRRGAVQDFIASGQVTE